MRVTDSQKKKIAQVVHRFVVGHRGHRVGYIKVLKLLYILDRESLHRWGYTATEDDYESLKNGPVLKDTMSCLQPQRIIDKTFAEFVQKDPMGKYLVPVVKEISYDEISDAESDLVDELLRKYSSHSTQEMIDLTHTFPEWKKTGGSRKTITIEDMATGVIRDHKKASKIAQHALKDRALATVFS